MASEMFSTISGQSGLILNLLLFHLIYCLLVEKMPCVQMQLLAFSQIIICIFKQLCCLYYGQYMVKA